MFGSCLEVANYEEVRYEPSLEEYVGESLQNILDSDRASPDTPAPIASFTRSLASNSVSLLVDDLLPSTSLK
jgi:hypothetical protein